MKLSAIETKSAALTVATVLTFSLQAHAQAPAPQPAPPYAQPAPAPQPAPPYAQPAPQPAPPYAQPAPAPQPAPPNAQPAPPYAAPYAGPAQQPAAPYAQPEPYPGQPLGAPGGIPPLASSPPDQRGRARDPRPFRLEWRPGEVVPPGYAPDTRPDVGMMVGGLVTFGVPYISSSVLAYVATVGEDPEFGPLFVPVVGPLIAMGTIESEGVGTYFLALDAITQAVGASLFVASLIREDPFLKRVGAADRGVELDFVAGPAGGGLRARF